jgi:FkbM family methyltransferase
MKIHDKGFAVLEGDALISKWAWDTGRLDHDATIQSYKVWIPEGGVVFDIGAYIGDHTVFYSKCVGENGAVFAFEPQEAPYECLEFNMKDLGNVECYKRALGKLDRQAAMIFNPSNPGASRIDLNRKCGVMIQTLDSFVFNAPKRELNQIDFIKIDVEGNEPDVLLGGRNTIMEYRPTIVIEINRGALSNYNRNPSDIYRLLEDMNYVWKPVPIQGGDIMTGPQWDAVCFPMER